MRKCPNCEFVLISFMGVRLKEFACFKCGHTEKFFNGCEKIEDKKLEIEAEKLKSKFYKEFEFEHDNNRTCKGINEIQFEEALKKLGMLKNG